MAAMPTPQPGLFAQGTRSHRHLEFDLRVGVEPSAVLRSLQPLRQPSVAAGGTNIVIGFGTATWSRLAGDDAPVGLRPLSVPGIASISHDVWVWMHGAGDDVLLDAARAVCRLLDPVATLASEVHGFVYRDSRDLTGFIDGTENPPVEEAYRVALVPNGEPGAGGSHALVQRWVHALDRFEALTVDDQEKVIGRTKADSVELDDDVKPATAHIARVVIEDDRGNELEIYRRSVPYGTTAEHGLMFVAFAADPTRPVKMLERMFGASGDGIRDQLTAFSTPVTGATYFVPSLEALGAALG